MGEYVDLYDENKQLTGERIFKEKGKKSLTPKGKYTIVVITFIINSEGKYLIQKTSTRKNGVWALIGGHVKSGQTSVNAIKEEIFEEIGIDIDVNDIKLFKTYKYEDAFKDVYIINKDIDLNKVKLEKDEVEKVIYLTKEEVYDLIKNNNLRKTNIDAIEDMFNC